MIKLTDDGKNYMTPEGVVPRATQILDLLAKPALVPWAVKVTCNYIGDKLLEVPPPWEWAQVMDVIVAARKESTRISEEAMDIGTEVHKLVEIWAKERITDPETKTTFRIDGEYPEVKNAMESFHKWATANHLEPIQSEQTGWNPTLRVAGTVDMIAKIKCKGWHKPRTYLVDLKSSKAHYDEHLYQVACYASFMGLPKLDGIGVLRLDKLTGEPDWKDYTSEWKHGFKVYKTLRELYRLIKGV